MAILKSRRFILRPYRKGDEPSLIKNINHKSVSRYLKRVPYPYTKKDAAAWLRRLRTYTKTKTAVPFAIDINGKVIGGIGLENIEGHKAEIGYWLGKKYWGKGIMTEAVKLITNFAFKRLKLKRVYGTIFSPNKASARVLEKNGYKLEGILRKHYHKDGKIYDGLMYAKIK